MSQELRADGPPPVRRLGAGRRLPRTVFETYDPEGDSSTSPTRSSAAESWSRRRVPSTGAPRRSGASGRRLPGVRGLPPRIEDILADLADQAACSRSPHRTRPPTDQPSAPTKFHPDSPPVNLSARRESPYPKSSIFLDRSRALETVGLWSRQCRGKTVKAVEALSQRVRPRGLRSLSRHKLDSRCRVDHPASTIVSTNRTPPYFHGAREAARDCVEFSGLAQSLGQSPRTIPEDAFEGTGNTVLMHVPRAPGERQRQRHPRLSRCRTSQIYHAPLQPKDRVELRAYLDRGDALQAGGAGGVRRCRGRTSEFVPDRFSALGRRPASSPSSPCSVQESSSGLHPSLRHRNRGPTRGLERVRGRSRPGSRASFRRRPARSCYEMIDAADSVVVVGAGAEREQVAAFRSKRPSPQVMTPCPDSTDHPVRVISAEEEAEALAAAGLSE